MTHDQDGEVCSIAEGKIGLNAGITSNYLAFTDGSVKKSRDEPSGSLAYQPTKTLKRNSVMNNDASTAVGAAIGLGLILFFLLIALVLYVFFCFCYKRICEKCGVTPGVLIWIPIVQLIPLLQSAKMPVWMIILLLIPIVNLVVLLMMWVKICQARGKSGWLVILLFIPIANLIFIPYLAFSE